MKTIIECNKFRIEGEPTDPLACILTRLERFTLEPALAPHVWARPIGKEGDVLPNHVQFFGNFEEVSGAFDVITDDKDVIAKLTAAIQANHAKPEYKTARRAYDVRKAERQARERGARR